MARVLRGNDARNWGTNLQANQDQLLKKMLTDDEQYREKLLKGFYLAHTTQGSPASRQIFGTNCSGQANQKSYLSSGRLMAR